MNIQELAAKSEIKVTTLITLAEKTLKKENISASTDIDFSDQNSLELAINDYRKNIPKKTALRKKSDKKIPEPPQVKDKPTFSPDSEQTRYKGADKAQTTTKDVDTEKFTQKITPPTTAQPIKQKITVKEENFEEDTSFVKKDKQKKEKLEKDKFPTKASLLSLIEEETEIETEIETDQETIPKTDPETKTTLNKKPTFSPHNKKKEFRKKKKHIFNPRKKEITITASLTAVQLASVIGKKVKDIFKILKQLNQQEDKNYLIEPNIAQLIAEELKIKVVLKTKSISELLATKDNVENLQPRPPIVTIMGHVDHGKTSLLDCIRNSNVAIKEKGNITQHIGAYSVKVSDNHITFLDTPGHEAFSAMRARGSNITDIIILVVAVDDGVKPQTIEAIQHAQAAKSTIIVAITKCDKPESNPKKIMEDLMQYNLIAEEYGGEITMLPVSSKTKDGINELLELIVLQASNMGSIK